MDSTGPILFPNWLGLVKGNKYVSCGNCRMWVCLGTRPLMGCDLRRGGDLPDPSSSVLSHSEIHFLHRVKMNLIWQNPPAYLWYAAKSPGLSLQCRRSKALQTALACFRSGYLGSMTFVQGEMFFYTCSCFSCSSCGLLRPGQHLLDTRPGH
ncbi:uncharacterized protein TNCV_4399021 [Trichonephila clavipes]|nr:uncharacterized protein TNCV_4399021 [Trichonephila clavipes]